MKTEKPIVYKRKYRIFGINEKGKLHTIRFESGFYDDIYDGEFDTEKDAVEFMQLNKYYGSFVVIPHFSVDFFPEE